MMKSIYRNPREVCSRTRDDDYQVYTHYRPGSKTFIADYIQMALSKWLVAAVGQGNLRNHANE